MAKRNCDIYGPDLSIHESQGKEIADVGMKSVRGTGATGKEEKSTGPDVSKTGTKEM
jgi:hypothetical protein